MTASTLALAVVRAHRAAAAALVLAVILAGAFVLGGEASALSRTDILAVFALPLALIQTAASMHRDGGCHDRGFVGRGFSGRGFSVRVLLRRSVLGGRFCERSIAAAVLGFRHGRGLLFTAADRGAGDQSAQRGGR